MAIESTTPKADKKRLVLVYPPLTMPTSPPLGVATLKGFLAREMAEWDVVPIHPYSRYMANFRDHALLIYRQRGLGAMIS